MYSLVPVWWPACASWTQRPSRRTHYAAGVYPGGSKVYMGQRILIRFLAVCH